MLATWEAAEIEVLSTGAVEEAAAAIEGPAEVMTAVGQVAATEERLRDLQALRRTLHKLADLQGLSGFPERIPLETVQAWL